jgi:predicted ATP-binding protein involved in virulence
MRIKKLILENFRLFEHLEVDFPDSNVIVLIGNNGSGKTSILDSLAICLTHLTGDLMSKNEGYSIDSWFTKDDVSCGKSKGRLVVKFDYTNAIKSGDEFREITVSKDINELGLKFDKQPDYFIKELKKQIQSNIVNSIPIISYYNINRTCINSNTQDDKKNLIYDEKLLSYKRALNIHASSFQDFEDWFLKQEIKENAKKVHDKNLEYELPSIKVVRDALDMFLKSLSANNYGKLSILRESTTSGDFNENVKEFLSVDKDGKSLKFNQLSSGERTIIGIVVEIARRLTIANDNKLFSLNGEGIVLIDELDLHLHPRWQKSIVNALTNTFPNVQFIVTTHSPIVLSGVRREQIIVLNDGVIIPNTELPNIYSGTADEILEDILFAPKASDEFEDEKKEIDILFNSNKFEDAEIRLQALKKKVKATPKWLKDYENRIAFVKA